MMPAQDELDWDALSAEWQSTRAPDAQDVAAIPAHVRRLVRWEGMRLRLLTAAEVLISLAVSAAVLAATISAPSALTIGWTIATAGLLAWTWRFAIRNRRGVWAPYAETSDAFIALSIERCRRSLATVGFTRLLVAVESGLLAPWLVWSMRHDSAWQSPDRRVLLVTVCIVTALYLIGVLVWTWWYRRRKLAELAGWKRMAQTSERESDSGALQDVV